MLAERGAVIEAAAATHGVFLQCAPARSGFSRVDDAHAGAGDFVREAAGERGDAGKALQEIQGGALRRKQRGRRAGDAEDACAALHPRAIMGEKLHLQCRVDAGKDAGGDTQPANHELLFGVDEGSGAMLGGEYRAARHIAQPGVFVDGEVNQVVDAGGNHHIRFCRGAACRCPRASASDAPALAINPSAPVQTSVRCNAPRAGARLRRA